MSPIKHEELWYCTRCGGNIWRGAFRHWCRDPVTRGRMILEHAHDQDLWRRENPTYPCPCHEDLPPGTLWGTFASDPSGLVLPSQVRI